MHNVHEPTRHADIQHAAKTGALTVRCVLVALLPVRRRVRFAHRTAKMKHNQRQGQGYRKADWHREAGCSHPASNTSPATEKETKQHASAASNKHKNKHAPDWVMVVVHVEEAAPAHTFNEARRRMRVRGPAGALRGTAAIARENHTMRVEHGVSKKPASMHSAIRRRTNQKLSSEA